MSTAILQDYRKHFCALLPTLMQKATHFTIDKRLLWKFFSRLQFSGCRLVFSCRSWTQLRYLTIRQPDEPFLLELPPQLEELYVCCDRPPFHVLFPWNRCQRVIHDWGYHRNPYLLHNVVCDEYLTRSTTCESLIDLFNLGYGYVKTMMYTPPKRFALLDGHSTPHTRRARTMQRFVRYSTPPPPYPLPPLEYIVVRKNAPLIKRCLKQMMQSWPENRDFYYDVYNLIKALNEIHWATKLDRDQVDEMQSEFSEIHMFTEEGRRWRDRIGRRLTCYVHLSKEEEFRFTLSPSSESERDSWDESDNCPKKRRIYANDPIPGYEHFGSPPPLYAK